MAPRGLTIGCLSLGTIAAALMFGADQASAQAADRKPNIVFMLADNLGYGELGVLRRRHSSRRADAAH